MTTTKHKAGTPLLTTNQIKKTARLLAEQEHYEDLPERREPLPDKALARMMNSAKPSDPLDFKAAVWDITGLGRLGVFDSKNLLWTQTPPLNIMSSLTVHWLYGLSASETSSSKLKTGIQSNKYCSRKT
jgi:hypothetical protein